MRTRRTIIDELRGGDRRSIGRSNQVVARLRHCPLVFPILIEWMHHPDELVRMRAADAAEKLTVLHPEWLQPFRVQLIKLAARETQQEVRWHLAQMLPRLELSVRDRAIVLVILRRYLKDQSRIVQTFAMQGLADLARQDSRLVPLIRALICSLIRKGSPAVKSRGRKLLLALRAITMPRHAPDSP